jgi:hypothetical protein
VTDLRANASGPRERPLGVWLFGLYFLVTAVANVATPILVQTMAPDVARSTADAFGVDWGLNLLLSILLSLLGFAAGVSFLLLWRRAVLVLQVLLSSSALVMVWHFLATRTLEIVGPLALLSPALSLGLIGWALVYACSLLRRGVLR